MDVKVAYSDDFICPEHQVRHEVGEVGQKL